VISDYRMPGMDGLTTLSRIAQINPAITRIILTGYATLEAAIEATNQGVDGFLTKPFDNLVLRRNIREIAVRKYLRQFVSEQVYQEIREAPGSDPAPLPPATIFLPTSAGLRACLRGSPRKSWRPFSTRIISRPWGRSPAGTEVRWTSIPGGWHDAGVSAPCGGRG
jgi:hypothetical protein